MAEETKTYRKLRGMSSAGGAFAWRLIIRPRSLWLADDHLLAVSAVFGFEQYRRFYFGDIRAFVFRLTSVRMVWNIVYAVLAVLALAVSAACVAALSESGADSEAKQVAFWICAGVSVLLLTALVLNNVFGPTCEVYIQTLAGLEPLGAPKRLATARRLEARLTPLIEAAQARPAARPEEPPAPAALPTP